MAIDIEKPTEYSSQIIYKSREFICKYNIIFVENPDDEYIHILYNNDNNDKIIEYYKELDIEVNIKSYEYKIFKTYEICKFHEKFNNYVYDSIKIDKKLIDKYYNNSEDFFNEIKEKVNKIINSIINLNTIKFEKIIKEEEKEKEEIINQIFFQKGGGDQKVVSSNIRFNNNSYNVKPIDTDNSNDKNQVYNIQDTYKFIIYNKILNKSIIHPYKIKNIKEIVNLAKINSNDEEYYKLFFHDKFFKSEKEINEIYNKLLSIKNFTKPVNEIKNKKENIKQYILRFYSVSDNDKDKIKVNEIYNRYGSIKFEISKEEKKLISDILKELGVEKKRFSDGYCFCKLKKNRIDLNLDEINNKRNKEFKKLMKELSETREKKLNKNGKDIQKENKKMMK